MLHADLRDLVPEVRVVRVARVDLRAQQALGHRQHRDILLNRGSQKDRVVPYVRVVQAGQGEQEVQEVQGDPVVPLLHCLP